MLSIFRKRKIKEEKVASIYVNSLLDMVDQGFSQVVAIINDDLEFNRRPNISEGDFDKFMLVVIAGNLSMLPAHFRDHQDIRLIDQIYRKLATSLGADLNDLKSAIAKYQNYTSRVNHPSKNVLYGMSKAVFFKYDLNPYQTEYFRNMKTPSPIFLKKLDEVMTHFVWNWEEFLNKHRIVE